MAIYMWRESPEYIKYKMNADSSWRLYVPVWWLTHSWWFWASYNWKVSVDDWVETTYSWTWSSWWSITLNWYTSGSSHTITITPVNIDYWWALAYWWQSTSWRTYLTEVIYDWSYMWYAESATSTGDYFRGNTYSQCENLTLAPQEVLPNTVTTIWERFRDNQYNSCTNLTSIPSEVLPSSVTSIWAYFRTYQYSYCSSILSAPEEALPSSVTSISVFFRNHQYFSCTSLNEIKWWKDLSIWSSKYRLNQFYGCNANKTVKVLSDVWYNSDDFNTLAASAVTQVSVPNAYLSNFKNSSNNPRVNIDDSKFVWY